MDVVAFLLARINEEETELLRAARSDPSTPSFLASPRLAECVTDDPGELEQVVREGTGDTADVQGSPEIATRSMLNILASGYAGHPDFDHEWAAGPNDHRDRYGPAALAATTPTEAVISSGGEVFSCPSRFRLSRSDHLVRSFVVSRKTWAIP